MCSGGHSGPTGPNSIEDLGEVCTRVVVDEHCYMEGDGQIYDRKEMKAVVEGALDLEDVETDILCEISDEVQSSGPPDRRDFHLAA